MLVLALYLKEIEEVCTAGSDLDQVFRGMGGWGGEGGYEEVLRSGDVLCDLDSFHPEGLSWEHFGADTGV